MYLIAKKLRRQTCYFQESRVRSQETLRLLIRQRDSEQDVWELLQRDRLLLLQSHSWLGRTPTWSRFRESPSLIGEETSSDDSPSRGTSRATGYALRISLLWPIFVCREISQVPHRFQMKDSTNKWDSWIFWCDHHPKLLFILNNWLKDSSNKKKHNDLHRLVLLEI